MKAVFIEQHGDASALHYGDFAKPDPAAGQVLVKIAAAGVNFIDVYQRAGLYKIPLPAVLGMEGAGTVEALGEGVSGWRPGDPVAWAMSRGSYAEFAVVPAHLLVKVPAGLDLRQAAAAMLQGMTAHYLTHSTFPIEPGHTALVHAAAGGTGRLISQMIKLRGGRVIGTAGTREKAEVARAAGAGDVILYREQDVVAEVKRLTDGKGVDVVYDGVGEATFMQSIDCSEAARHDGFVRTVERPREARRSLAVAKQRFAISHAPNARQLRFARRNQVALQRCAGLDSQQETGPVGRARLPVSRRRPSAHGS